MAKVVFKNVTRRFDDLEVVKNINLEIEDKEFFVLVGPSGCGKSTTLRMLAGLEQVDSGDIWIDNRWVNDVPPKDRDIAMVFQNYALYPHMTAYQNMAFGLKLRKHSKSEIDQRVREAADILNIEKLLDRKPKELSGGQRQRVAVGRSIVRKPKVFLFDEPLSNLDAKMRVQMRAELCKLHERLQVTMIYVTHDQQEAMTMGNRICVLKEGEIQQLDTPINVYNNPINKFVAGFIGSPPMNFLKVTVETGKNGHIWLNEGNARFKMPGFIGDRIKSLNGTEVTLGIRPEDIYDKVYYIGAPPDEGQIAKGTVEVVQMMGAEKYLYLTTGKHPFIARVHPNNQAHVGQQIDLVFNLERAHIFDTATQKAIV